MTTATPTTEREKNILSNLNTIKIYSRRTRAQCAEQPGHSSIQVHILCVSFFQFVRSSRRLISWWLFSSVCFFSLAFLYCFNVKISIHVNIAYTCIPMHLSHTFGFAVVVVATVSCISRILFHISSVNDFTDSKYHRTKWIVWI